MPNPCPFLNLSKLNPNYPNYNLYLQSDSKPNPGGTYLNLTHNLPTRYTYA